MMKSIVSYTKSQLFWLVALRVVIGWHFLYEGLVKLSNPNWSSVSFLLDSEGLFKGIFESMATNPNVLKVVDLLNIWGLIAIGLGLIVGLLSRWALIAGMVMLASYYLSHPPFIGLVYDMPMEGSYLIVNRILIELIALIVLLLFPTSKQVGLDRFIFKTDNGR
jgi:thiosulfate dehydrogenase [quinone] large subunit